MKPQTLQSQPRAAILVGLWAAYETVSLGLAWIAADPTGPFASKLSPAEIAYFAAITPLEFLGFGLSTVLLWHCAFFLLRASPLALPATLSRFIVFLAAMA